MQSQLAIDFAAIAPQDETFPIAYLKKAYRLYSGDTIAQGKIRGLFYHQNNPYCCTGACHQSGLSEVFLNRLYTPLEITSMNVDGKNTHATGKEVKHKKSTWIIGERIIIRPHPKEREIDKAKYALAWAQQFLARFPNPDDPMTFQDDWRDYYTRQIEDTRASQAEARQTLDRLGLSQLFTTPEELSKYWGQEMKS